MSDAATRIAALEADAAAARKRVQELIADYHRLLERTDEQRAAYEAHMSVVEADAREEGRRAGLEQAAAWLTQQAAEKGGTKTPQGRTAQYYARAIRAMKDKP